MMHIRSQGPWTLANTSFSVGIVCDFGRSRKGLDHIWYIWFFCLKQTNHTNLAGGSSTCWRQLEPDTNAQVSAHWLQNDKALSVAPRPTSGRSFVCFRFAFWYFLLAWWFLHKFLHLIKGIPLLVYITRAPRLTSLSSRHVICSVFHWMGR